MSEVEEVMTLLAQELGERAKKILRRARGREGRVIAATRMEIGGRHLIVFIETSCGEFLDNPNGGYDYRASRKALMILRRYMILDDLANV